MSSLRNAVKRITHKERAQPGARKKFGLLEKHKDYVQRARDFHNKQDYLKTLKKKAEGRNPDEFYFKMHKSQVSEKGEHKELKDGSLDTSAVKLLKSQDYGYIVHKKAVDDKKAEKLKKNVKDNAKEPTKKEVLDAEALAAKDKKAKLFLKHAYFKCVDESTSSDEEKAEFLGRIPGPTNANDVVEEMYGFFSIEIDQRTAQLNELKN